MDNAAGVDLRFFGGTQMALREECITVVLY